MEKHPLMKANGPYKGYHGMFNLQAALLMLFVYDSEKKELTRQKTGVSIRAAAKALHTTEYKLRLVIDVFNLHGEAGVRKMQHGAGRPAKLLNIT